MRPSRRLLFVSLIALAVSILAVAAGQVPDQAAIAIWVILGAALALDLFISPSRRSFILSVVGPEEVYSGETARFQAHISTAFARLPADIEGRFDLGDGYGTAGLFQFHAIGDEANSTAEVTARRRGNFPIRTIWLKWTSRLGLLEMTPKFAIDAALRVVPNIRPISSGQIEVKVRSELFGVKENMMRGEGSEFHQLRDFTTGMDTRSIDWKRSARHGGLVAKEMRAERNHQVILCLDNGYLMREQIDGLPKIDHSVNAALAMAWAAGLGGDLVGVFSFDSEPRVYLPPQPGRAAFPRLRSLMAGLDYQSVESNPTLAMAYLNTQLRRRSLIVIFSDFVDTTSAELLVENIQVLSRHHVIIFVAIRDPAVEQSARAESHTLQSVAEAVAAGQLMRERQIVLDDLTRLGVICIDTRPNELTPRLVSAYLNVKAREVI